MATGDVIINIITKSGKQNKMFKVIKSFRLSGQQLNKLRVHCSLEIFPTIYLIRNVDHKLTISCDLFNFTSIYFHLEDFAKMLDVDVSMFY
jgi:hypothetical protein